jgi:hypothetical protein
MSDHSELVVREVPRINQSKVATKTFELKVTVPVEFPDSDGDTVPQHQVEEFVSNELAWYETVIGENLSDIICSEFGVDGVGSFIEIQINEVA